MITDKDKDHIFSDPVENIEDFCFDESVARVFDDMISRSVPGYRSIVAATGALAGQFIQENSHCYDLGCSLGATSLSILQHCKDRTYTLVAIDNAQAMIDQAAKVLCPAPDEVDVQLVCDDIRNIKVENASVVVLNFVLQFIKPEERQDMLEGLISGMRKDSCLILSEKIRFDNQEQQLYFENLHYKFKKLQGYSDLEISQKRTALEQVLVPDTVKVHFSRLKEAGFVKPCVWFQDLNFISLCAFKE